MRERVEHFHIRWRSARDGPPVFGLSLENLGSSRVVCANTWPSLALEKPNWWYFFNSSVWASANGVTISSKKKLRSGSVRSRSRWCPAISRLQSGSLRAMNPEPWNALGVRFVLSAASCRLTPAV